MVERLAFDTWPAAVYAVGDVHGSLRELLALEQEIVDDGAGIAGEKWIVMLGDYIDRGPQSAGVIAHLVASPPEGFRRFCLRGNHEQMLLDYLADPHRNDFWLYEGGAETLRSYGVPASDIASGVGRRIAAALPGLHRDFLAALPLMLTLPGWIFVHAGIRPGVPLDRQRAEDLIWIREPFLSAPALPGWRIVHGHTPGRGPVTTAARICIDTHCFRSGRLGAVRITSDGAIRFLST